MTNALMGAIVAIANRGEIAIRIAATCRKLGAVPVLLLGDPDLRGHAARTVGRVERVGEAGSELDPARVVAAAERAGAVFLHPGYGFLSERADLAEACEKAGIRFVGPSPATLRLCGDKLATRAAAERAGVPVLAASGPLGDDPDAWLAEASRIGYPLLVKPAGAGGGRGLRHVADEGDLVDAVAASRSEGGSAGKDTVVYLERALVAPRHVEVQIAAAGGHAIALGDRDCSLQRRHQKVIEEAPAPNVSDATRQALHGHARRLAEEVGLENVATCEFLLGQGEEVAFLEVNPRIQVEHPVTELVTGVDLVEWQLRIAAGTPPALKPVAPDGHAVEARIYAEEPAVGFRPAPGRLATVAWPSGPDIRVDAGYASGDEVPHAYDPMLAKVVARAPDRDAAIAMLRQALLDTVAAGVSTNISWLLDLLDSEAFRTGVATTQTASEVVPTVPDHSVAPYAALAHLLDAVPAGSPDAWTLLGPWRLTGRVPVTLHGSDWEARIDIRRAGDSWDLRDLETGVTARWVREADGVLAIDMDGEVTRAVVVSRGAGLLEVFARGGRWPVVPGPRSEVTRELQAAASDGQVRAPMPGSVVRLHIAPGDRVERGAALLTLTAMKMEIELDAPADAMVEAVSCAEGDLVAADQVLVTLRLDHWDET